MKPCRISSVGLIQHYIYSLQPLCLVHFNIWWLCIHSFRSYTIKHISAIKTTYLKNDYLFLLKMKHFIQRNGWFFWEIANLFFNFFLSEIQLLNISSQTCNILYYPSSKVSNGLTDISLTAYWEWIILTRMLYPLQYWDFLGAFFPPALL